MTLILRITGIDWLKIRRDLTRSSYKRTRLKIDLRQRSTRIRNVLRVIIGVCR